MNSAYRLISKLFTCCHQGYSISFYAIPTGLLLFNLVLSIVWTLALELARLAACVKLGLTNLFSSLTK